MNYAVGVARETPFGRHFSIAKISLFDDSRIEYINKVHDQLIKAVCCSPHGDGMILSTSFDKTLKLSSMNSNNLLISFALEAPGWSCCFDPQDRNLVYVGLGNGKICMFDLRKTEAQPVVTISSSVGERISPVHSLTVFAPEQDWRLILMATLHGPMAIRIDQNGEVKGRSFVDISNLNQCSSFVYDPDFSLWAAASRGSSSSFALGTFSNEITLKKTITCTNAQANMVRPALFHLDSSPLLAYPDGSAVHIVLLDSSSLDVQCEQKIDGMPTNPILDCNLSAVDNKIYTGLLSSRQLNLYFF